MFSLFLIFLVLNAGISLIFYLISNELYLAIILFGILFFTSIINVFVIYRKHLNLKNKFKECLFFIEKFIVTYSARNSIAESLDSINDLVSDKTKTMIKENKNDFKNLIEQLKLYYNFEIFDIFASIIMQYMETGGDLLSSSEFLLLETSRLKSTNTTIQSFIVKNSLSFYIMWAFSFLIMIVARFSLSDFYESFSSSKEFVLAIFAGFLLYGISTVFHFRSLFDLSYIRKNNYEKV